MASVTLKGKTMNTVGELPSIGDKAPDFVLVDAALRNRTLSDFAGSRKLLNIMPSVDTSVCAKSVRTFNKRARDAGGVMLMVSGDLPFAQKRFCDAEDIRDVELLSMMRSRNFGKDYGVLLEDGPLEGITARAVVVIDENDHVRHAELVSDIGQEPDYDAAIAALQQ